MTIEWEKDNHLACACEDNAHVQSLGDTVTVQPPVNINDCITQWCLQLPPESQAPCMNACAEAWHTGKAQTFEGSTSTCVEGYHKVGNDCVPDTAGGGGSGSGGGGGASTKKTASTTTTSTSSSSSSSSGTALVVTALVVAGVIYWIFS